MSDEGSGSGPLYEGWAALAAAVVAMGLAAALAVNGRDFCLDDAWIHLSYAKSLRLGEGLSYNPGDWQTGFSSPLWVFLLSVWPTGPDALVPVKLLGALLHGLTAFLASTAAMDVAKSRASVSRPVPLVSIALLAGVLAASTPTLLQGAVSGMEVALASSLILGATVAMLRRFTSIAFVVGFFAVLARPEALFFVFAFAGALFFHRRERVVAWAPLGALTALLAWVVYCLALTGYPWPNTQYVKAAEPGLSGLSYLADQVFPWQPWLISLGGLVLIALAIRQELEEKRFELSAIMIGWLATVLAIAVSRPLHEGVLFFESRYFAIVAALPAVVLALALVEARRWLVIALAVPVALVTSLQMGEVRDLLEAQEDDVWRLHTAPARYVAEELPEDTTVVVEGAGALRYFTPRTMTIVDLIGLNDDEIAHAEDDNERACVLVRRGPTHFVLPEHIAMNLAKVFELRPLQIFEDPSYAQVEEPHPMRVIVFEGEARPEWVQRCEASGRRGPDGTGS